jgi:hypothetical protein
VAPPAKFKEMYFLEVTTSRKSIYRNEKLSSKAVRSSPDSCI